MTNYNFLNNNINVFRHNRKILLPNNKLSYNYFKVLNAGTLKISKTNDYTKDNITGFNIGVSWGKLGYAGGVISNEDALKLANHIIENIKPNSHSH